MGCGCGSKSVQSIRPQQIPESVKPQNKIIHNSGAVRVDQIPLSSITPAPQSLKCPKCNSHTVRVNISGRTRIQCSNNQCRKILS